MGARRVQQGGEAFNEGFEAAMKAIPIYEYFEGLQFPDLSGVIQEKLSGQGDIWRDWMGIPTPDEIEQGTQAAIDAFDVVASDAGSLIRDMALTAKHDLVTETGPIWRDWLGIPTPEEVEWEMANVSNVMVAEIQRTASTVQEMGSLFSSSFTLIANGIRSGGAAAAAAMAQVAAQILTKIGGHLIGQGTAEVALGMAPPPFGPRADLITHGTKLIATGGVLTTVGAVAGAAGSGVGAVAGAVGAGGAPGSAYNPIYTQESPLSRPGEYTMDVTGQRPITTQASPYQSDGALVEAVTQLNGHFSRLSATSPGNVVVLGVEEHGGIVPLMENGGEIGRLSDHIFDDPRVR